MKKGYSVDLRKRVVESVLKEGKTIAEVSEVYKVHYETVRNWLKLYKTTGKFKKEIKENQVRPYKLDWEGLKKDLQENPDSYLAERGKRFGVVASTIWKALKKMGIKPKKRVSTIKSRINKTT